MNSTLIAELRDAVVDGPVSVVPAMLIEAADKIERLTKALQRIADADSGGGLESPDTVSLAAIAREALQGKP